MSKTTYTLIERVALPYMDKMNLESYEPSFKTGKYGEYVSGYLILLTHPVSKVLYGVVLQKSDQLLGQIIALCCSDTDRPLKVVFQRGSLPDQIHVNTRLDK